MRTVLLILVFVLTLTGCSTISFERYVTVEVMLVEKGGLNTNGLSGAQALRIFEEVTSNIGYILKGPVSDPANPAEISCSAHPSGKLARNDAILYLQTHIREKKIFISASAYGAEEDLAPARKLIALFKEELELRGVRYIEYSGYSPFAP